MDQAALLAQLPKVQDFLGPWMIGSWINGFLYTLELIYVVHYVNKYPHDPWFLKAGIAIVATAGGITVISSWVGAYSITITHFGNPLKAMTPAVWMALTPLMAGLTSLIGQQYLISRYLRASKQRIMAAVLSTCSLAGFGFCLWAFIVLVKLADGNLSVESQLRTAGRLVNSTTAAVDITIALSLAIFLYRMSDTEIVGTQKLLQKLILMSFETGGITSAIALVTMVVFILQPRNWMSFPFSAATGYVQALCLLYNLCIRGSTDQVSSTTSARINSNMFSMSKIGSHRLRPDVPSHIEVHQATVVFEETDEAFDEEKGREKARRAAGTPGQ